MTDYNDPLPGSGVSFWTMAAAAVGSLLTLRTLVDSSPITRGVAVVSSWGLSFFTTPGVTEWLGATRRQEKPIREMTPAEKFTERTGLTVQELRMLLEAAS